ncbi:ABC transporter ATP-binding protein [Candidatus Methanodesulfokora washburnensis]|jgi:simple sugar transport system ATP-binding protein|uniref:ABC transporter ATP-binding protein n=1 Tax=Candidatus Methanodesulfokora washburnensis TaxID=2478471 RepID=A0A3R9QZC2_9CREN|nr:ABC transporter ATP-binding protein [Candidatus Methanodesulfokores washburnensis]RSN75718.1 ABC transporter ATP-binding protein [Candidatus Methanodesulfokores washburnensis]
MEPLVRMVGIRKTFPGIVANDNVDFELMPGEIHALLGENGAGKTTLMNILYGIYRPDSGRIYVKGKEVSINSPADAIKLGIGMVHQNFLLIDSFTVAENVALGFAKKQIRPDIEVKRRIIELGERYGLKVDPDAYVWQLSAGEKQRVEIIKALYRESDVLILDEPTSVLTPIEVNELFSTLKKLKSEGKGIVFITHKLEEVFQVADRVTVMRKGRVVGVKRRDETSKEELARMMVGREILFRVEKKEGEKGPVILEVVDLKALNDKGVLALKGVSFKVHSGEIFGIAGVAGNGQRELIEVITGLRKAISGKVLINGIDMTNRSPREIGLLGTAHIPEERVKMGIMPGMDLAENLILKKYFLPPFCRKGILDLKSIRSNAEKLKTEYDIVAPSIRVKAKFLSGGNIQRLILARELSSDPKLVIAAHPTYGLDVGATEYIRRKLVEERDKGAAVLLVSEDLEEILSLSDTIAVMYQGEIMGIGRPDEFSMEEIGLMMAGSRRMKVIS